MMKLSTLLKMVGHFLHRSRDVRLAVNNPAIFVAFYSSGS